MASHPPESQPMCAIGKKLAEIGSTGGNPDNDAQILLGQCTTCTRPDCPVEAKVEYGTYGQFTITTYNAETHKVLSGACQADFLSQDIRIV